MRHLSIVGLALLATGCTITIPGHSAYDDQPRSTAQSPYPRSNDQASLSGSQRNDYQPSPYQSQRQDYQQPESQPQRDDRRRPRYSDTVSRRTSDVDDFPSVSDPVPVVPRSIYSQACSHSPRVYEWDANGMLIRQPANTPRIQQQIPYQPLVNQMMGIAGMLIR